MLHHMQWRGRTPLAQLGIVSCLLAGLAKAHEHHNDMIKEGDFISDDPIVRAGTLRGKPTRLTGSRTRYYGYTYF